MNIYQHSIKNIISLLLVACLGAMTLSGCDISSKHLEMKYEENDNDDIVGWNSVEGENVSDWTTQVVSSWDDVDDYSEWVAAQIIFDDITDDYPIIECHVLDFKSNGKYFDGEKVYTLVNDQFDVNSFIAKYAVGSGVIVICIILTVATSPTPICCFFAGAADASVSMAIKGAAFGAATNAVIEAIKSEGDIETTFYGALEGSAEGYMWGAIYGAATGGFNSKYCFTSETVVLSEKGMVPISEINTGDRVYSYDENKGTYDWEEVSQVIKGKADEVVRVTTYKDELTSTGNHPYLTNTGWKKAEDLTEKDLLLSTNSQYVPVKSIETITEQGQDVFSLCVNNSHTFIVGRDSVVVHNRCNPNEKHADSTRHFPEDSELAKKYPDGVYIKPNGYPDFSPYADKVVTFETPTKAGVEAGKCLRGDCYYDFKMANKAAFGVDSVTATPKGYTWHHCEDGKTMQLIPSDLHRGIGHDGGEKVIAQMLSGK